MGTRAELNLTLMPLSARKREQAVQELLSPEQAEGEAWLKGLRLTLE
jgi:hypothetical protein